MSELITSQNIDSVIMQNDAIREEIKNQASNNA